MESMLIPASQVQVGDRIQVSSSMYPSEVMHKVTKVERFGDAVHVYWGRKSIAAGVANAWFNQATKVHVMR